ncbi:MAG: hypothetical protein OQK64_03310 [Ignavibacteriaceae bacterium]|jgi:hypothetical protein|nr:hypothetical protein [Ignavibacteriaceae bacterium]
MNFLDNFLLTTLLTLATTFFGLFIVVQELYKYLIDHKASIPAVSPSVSWISVVCKFFKVDGKLFNLNCN